MRWSILIIGALLFFSQMVFTPVSPSANTVHLAETEFIDHEPIVIESDADFLEVSSGGSGIDGKILLQQNRSERFK
ncbi:MAG: hypothetical protein KAR35_04745 [Candidatus Heimdallarchaeota archaeon]|nr:hypothetical protein [Candidatus Heimdallarchaeota archaeon]MCK5048663.1 hypothetical protein [Candidatus Heimdallarchaeota archaeon]